MTGAAAGIGRATAEALAAFGCAGLALCDRDEAGLDAVSQRCRETGATVVPAVIDVRDADAVERHVGAAVDELGGFDVLVNNAGGTFWSPFADVAAKGEAALIAENFGQVAHFTRQCLRSFRDGGSIINVTSSEAHRAAPGFAVYAAMKAAQASLAKSLALELADRRIRVNCIAPDGIPTDGDAGLQAESMAAARPWIPAPLGLGTVDDAANAIVFLASDMSRYITGSTLQVNGGSVAAGGWKQLADGSWRV